MSSGILVVDDEKDIRKLIRHAFGRQGYEVHEAADGASARALLRERSFDFALFDLRLPDGVDGLTLISEARTLYPELPIVLITGYASVPSAVEAIKRGAYDYLAKPLDVKKLQSLAESVIARTSATPTGSLRLGLESLRGPSESMQGVRDSIARVAQHDDVTVFLRGESGTGKDHAARVLHHESGRSSHPFMHVTCTAIPDSLLESELFGHERGSFTDAKTTRQGIFERAHGGTVYLDEIGDMSPSLQSKLLHVLQYRSFRRVGSTEERAAEVRIVAATNRDLAVAMKNGEFRADLYHRLNVVTIELPPLRARPEDVLPTAQTFLDSFTAQRLDTPRLTREAKDALVAHSWPGNVRELRNAIQRGMTFCDHATITAKDLHLVSEAIIDGPAGDGLFLLPPQGVRLDDVERDLVRQALVRCRGNRTAAGALLGLSRDQIRYKIAKYDDVITGA